MFDRDRLTPVADLETLARVEALRAELATMIAEHAACVLRLSGSAAAEVVQRKLDVLLFADAAVKMLYD